MTVTVISKSPPGGRCTLYTRYAEALSGLFGLTLEIHCPSDAPWDGPPPPALIIRGQVVEPSDGVIVAPEDIVTVLNSTELGERLADCRAELERIQDDFLTEMSRIA
jgi:hypothetical protein